MRYLSLTEHPRANSRGVTLVATLRIPSLSTPGKGRVRVFPSDAKTFTPDLFRNTRRGNQCFAGSHLRILQQPIPHRELFRKHFREGDAMCDGNQNGVGLLRQRREQFADDGAGLGVEISGWLVAE